MPRGTGIDAEYERPELRWTQSSFVQPQMMVHDRFFYDSVARRYTVDRYLKDLEVRYGGIDSVLVWPTYPNIGIDDRNQYDLFADLPGGREGIREFIADFHRRGVKVLFPVMLWDQGTRKEDIPDAQALSRELVDANADGINGDTLEGIPRTFRSASDSLGHPLALEPELGPASDEMLNYNNMSWGYWKYDFVPTVSRYKWLETRHMINISDRWAHNHTDDLQSGSFDQESGYACALRLLNLLPRPTAIFTASDLMAVGVLAAVKNQKLRCPKDISIISFDGLSFTQMTEPAITSIFQPSYQLGYSAVRLLLERINGLDSAPQDIVLDTELKMKDSVRRLT